MTSSSLILIRIMFPIYFTTSSAIFQKNLKLTAFMDIHYMLDVQHI